MKYSSARSGDYDEKLLKQEKDNESLQGHLEETPFSVTFDDDIYSYRVL